jgi:hypothetical protein
MIATTPHPLFLCFLFTINHTITETLTFYLKNYYTLAALLGNDLPLPQMIRTAPAAPAAANCQL